VRRELRLDGKLAFGAIGRIYPLKNYPALLDAFAAGVGDDPDAWLVIAGPGDARGLARQAGQLGIGDRIVFTGPRDDVPQLLAALDVFVHPAIAESFGMVIIEAMAMAKPVLSAPVGIAPEVIEQGNNGVLTDGSSARALADGLGQVISARARWNELGAAARVTASGFTAARMAERYAELYRRWLCEAAASGRGRSEWSSPL
jgi:glycosyltransferase involved in cell wall biosynthesis